MAGWLARGCFPHLPSHSRWDLNSSQGECEGKGKHPRARQPAIHYGWLFIELEVDEIHFESLGVLPLPLGLLGGPPPPPYLDREVTQ